MTQPEVPVTSGEVEPRVLSLAQLLQSHPNAQRALRGSIERQQQKRHADRAARPTLPMHCPHCSAPGIVYLTLPGPDGAREYRRRPEDCCQSALRDAAERALHYALNPNNDAEERVEAADRYTAIKESITRPDLLRELATHEAILADVEQRVSGLPGAQGGVG